MAKEGKFRKRKKREGRKGVSPVVSTILLIMIVVVAAIIILLLIRSFMKEAISKQDANGNEIEISKMCSDVVLTPVLNEDGSFGVINEGNVPLSSITLKLSSGGSITSVSVGDFINPGYSQMVDSLNANDYEAIKVIPVLRGKIKNSGLVSQSYICPESDGIIIK